MNAEKVALARKIARQESTDPETAKLLWWLADAYRMRCIALERLTKKISDLGASEFSERQTENKAEDEQ